MKFLRFLLSGIAIAAVVPCSQFVLPLRHETNPFSGWGDGAQDNVTTLAGPVTLVWLVTMFALMFVCIKPHHKTENSLISLGRWLTNIVLFIMGIILAFLTQNRVPPPGALYLWGFAVMVVLWLFFDTMLTRPKEWSAKSKPSGFSAPVTSRPPKRKGTKS